MRQEVTARSYPSLRTCICDISCRSRGYVDPPAPRVALLWIKMGEISLWAQPHNFAELSEE
jgi:hypothetical protein